MLKNGKNKHYHDAADDEGRPLKIQKLMTMMKLDDDPPPPPPSRSIQKSINRVRVRMRKEESDDENPLPPPKKLRKLMKTTEEEETMTTKSMPAVVVAWGDLPPEVLELIVKRLGQFDYGSFLRVCKSWGQLKPDVVIQLDLGGGDTSTIPIRIKRC